VKIALCSSIVPFIRGGGRNIVDWLEIELRKAGHQVEVVYLPTVETPGKIFDQMAAFRLVDLSESADRIICFRPPAYVIPHPHKILWFIHHYRAFYDLWDTQYRTFPDDERHRHLREALRLVDDAALAEAKTIFTNSAVVSDRLRKYNQVESEVLYPPIFEPERFQCVGFNDEIAYVCRVEHHKRQHLLVEAMRYTTTPVRLRLYGASSGPIYSGELIRQISDARLEARVVFEDRWISEAGKVAALSECLAAAYLPLDEDSYGYPSLEAAHSGKPILSTTDAGGVSELVVHGVHGLLASPDPRALADAMDRLYLDRAATKRMGENARARIGELSITWENTLARLLA